MRANLFAHLPVDEIPHPVPDTHFFTSTVAEVKPNLLREYVVPGAAVVMIQKGKAVWMHGYGFANVASGTRVAAETVLNVGSTLMPGKMGQKKETLSCPAYTFLLVAGPDC